MSEMQSVGSGLPACFHLSTILCCIRYGFFWLVTTWTEKIPGLRTCSQPVCARAGWRPWVFAVLVSVTSDIMRQFSGLRSLPSWLVSKQVQHHQNCPAGVTAPHCESGQPSQPCQPELYGWTLLPRRAPDDVDMWQSPCLRCAQSEAGTRVPHTFFPAHPVRLQCMIAACAVSISVRPYVETFKELLLAN